MCLYIFKCISRFIETYTKVLVLNCVVRLFTVRRTTAADHYAGAGDWYEQVSTAALFCAVIFDPRRGSNLWPAEREKNCQSNMCSQAPQSSFLCQCACFSNKDQCFCARYAYTSPPNMHASAPRNMHASAPNMNDLAPNMNNLAPN